MSAFTLRPYQQQSIDAAWDWMRQHDGNPAIVLPTGSGKSLVLAELARQVVEQWGGRVGILAHVRELVEQNYDKLTKLWPQAKAGIYSAGLRRRDRFDPILCMQIQSVATKAAQLGRFDVLLVDECHRIPLKGDGLYLQFIRECRRFNHNLRVIGLSATPYRLQGAAIPVCGPENVLTAIAYEARIGDLIRDGYLCPLSSRAGKARADLSGVSIRGGEYVERELARAVDRAELVDAACDELCVLAVDRRAWIVFAVTVEHAEHVCAALKARGITAAIVHGAQVKSERDAAITAFQRGDLRALVNVNVLSEGFDAPHIDCVAMLRPTKSPGLYYQQCGRGFRLHSTKRDCLILDFAGNTIEHGPIDEIRVAKPRPRVAAQVQKGAAKSCNQCQAIVPIAVRQCPDCGNEFPAPERQMHAATAFDAPILGSEREPTRHAVASVEFHRHEGRSGIPSLRVTYHCGLATFREWVFLEHSGPTRSKAAAWWALRNRDPMNRPWAPRTVDEALLLAPELLTPTRIAVREGGKYPEITAYEFASSANAPSTEPESRLAATAAQSAGTIGADHSRHQLRGMRRVCAGLLQHLEGERAA